MKPEATKHYTIQQMKRYRGEAMWATIIFYVPTITDAREQIAVLKKAAGSTRFRIRRVTQVEDTVR